MRSWPQVAWSDTRNLWLMRFMLWFFLFCNSMIVAVVPFCSVMSCFIFSCGGHTQKRSLTVCLSHDMCISSRQLDPLISCGRTYLSPPDGERVAIGKCPDDCQIDAHQRRTNTLAPLPNLSSFPLDRVEHGRPCVVVVGDTRRRRSRNRLHR